MEHISTAMAQETDESGLTRRPSPSPPSSTRTIPAERHAAIFEVINLTRKMFGWGIKTAADLDPEIRVWAMVFDDYRIPTEALARLWKRGRDLRIDRLNHGLNCPDLNAELLAACWVGPHGLKSEMEQERVGAGRTLGENAASQCPYCKGSGFREVRDQQGRVIGVKRGCDHRD